MTQQNQGGAGAEKAEKSVKQQAGDMAGKVGEQLRDAGEHVKDAAKEKYEQLRQHASDYYNEGKQRANEWEQGIEDYVQQQPVKSLLIAAGVGVLLGMLMKRS